MSAVFGWSSSLRTRIGAAITATPPKIKTTTTTTTSTKYLSHYRHEWFSSRSSSSSSTSIAPFDTVGIVGLGLMGHGICQVAAMSGVHKSIIAYESQDQFLHSGQSRIEASMNKLIAKDKITSDKAQQILSSIQYTTNISDLSNVDFVVEAVIENIDLKKDLYQTLHNTCKPQTIFASNTSSLSITEMAISSRRPENFVGIHFFNPVQIMKLVEVISTNHTDPIVYEKAKSWVYDINKVAVSCGDTPGFIVNRLLVPSILQAMLMLDRKDATIIDIDTSMKLGAGHPMGPLHLADYIGLDTLYFIVKGWLENYPNEPAFIMPKILENMIAANNLGRKTGKGFYHWDGDQCGDPVK